MKLYLNNKDVDITKLTVDDINNLLIQKIKDYVDSTKNIQLEKKPNEFQNSENNIKTARTIDDELQEIQKSNETKIDRQLYNVAENIMLSYFSLDTTKFMAVIQRINCWGLQLTLQEFILDYYLFCKTNKYLKQFVLMHLDKLITLVSSMIEKQLITKLNLYNFNVSNTSLNTLKEKLIQKQKELQKVQPSDLVIDRENQVVDMDKVAQMKLDILNDLKQQHPQLQD